MRHVVLVLDSVGVGALPDAADYGDEGSNTIGNTARHVGGLCLPNLGRLGLGNVTDVAGVPPRPRGAIDGAWGRMAMRAPGKDTMTGHWELAGVVAEQALRTFPNGFPPPVIAAFERAVGRGTLGNVAASGTEIIARLGAEHVASGRPIVYTSADSVFQVASHEDVIPVDELYRMCEAARAIMTGEFLVGRIIARPFAGVPGAFARTPRRRDYALQPPRPTVLDGLVAAGCAVHAVGKVDDIFAGRGLTHAHHTRDNGEGILVLGELLGTLEQGLVFANLVDFDMLYGHRNDPAGYARALEEVDRALPGLRARLGRGNLMFICADHGCDPTTKSTDHSREYVPILVCGPPGGASGGIELGERETMADLGATLAALYGLPPPGAGTSFHDAIAPLRQ